jgi:NADH dehydrogenase
MQQARSVVKNIRRTLRGEERVPFSYFDKGSMATIGRSRAIAQVGRLRLSGLIAWFAWLFIHIWYLVGFKNRVFVLMQWIWSYVMYRRGARLITGPRIAPPREKAADVR